MQGARSLPTGMTPATTRLSAGRVSILLWLLLGAFVLRVLAQILQWQIGLAFLPPFDAWQSGALPYPVLLAAQWLIVLLLARTAWRYSRGAVSASPRAARLWLIPGSIYLLAMLTRLILGLTLLDGHAWFDRPLPSTFHLVLASFMLADGGYHLANRRAA